jgi:type II secretory pathway pseudopilin PulG
MQNSRLFQTGFSLAELAIVLFVVAVLVGTTLATISTQQELRQYKEADREMDKILDVIVGFAQANGRLPCPSAVAAAGVAGGGGDSACTTVSGFVPWVTLGVQGSLTNESLLADPWGNPYRYYVSSTDSNGDGNADFTFTGQMREIGLGDKWDNLTDPDNPAVGSDGIRDLDGQFVICDAAATTFDICDGGANEVFGNAPTTKGPYQGAVVVLVSVGKNGAKLPDFAANPDEYENYGSTPAEPGSQYYVKNSSTVLGVRRTTFVKRTTGFADDFDDIVKWIAPTTLFTKMIEAGQLP